jgi:hypothetical protein
VCFLGQEKNDLPEVIPDEALIGVPGQASEGEPDQLLKEQEVLLLVGVELVEGIQLVRGTLQSQDEVIGQQFNDVLVEGLRLVVVGAVRLDQHELQAEICAILGVVDEIPEELIHVGLEDVPEVDRVVDLREDQHEVFEVPLLVRLLIRVQIVDMQNFKDPESISEDGGEDAALLCSQGALVGEYEVDSLQGRDFHGVVDLDILGEEGFGDLMGQGNAFLQQFGLDLTHVHRVVA